MRALLLCRLRKASLNTHTKNSFRSRELERYSSSLLSVWLQRTFGAKYENSLAPLFQLRVWPLTRAGGAPWGGSGLSEATESKPRPYKSKQPEESGRDVILSARRFFSRETRKQKAREAAFAEIGS